MSATELVSEMVQASAVYHSLSVVHRPLVRSLEALEGTRSGISLISIALDLKQAKGSRGFGGRPQRVSGAEQQSAVVELCELSLLHRPMFPFWVGRRGGAGASGLRLQRTMVSNVAAKRVGRASGRTHPASDSKTAGDRRFVDCRERSARGSGSWPDGTWQNPSATTSAFLPDVV